MRVLRANSRIPMAAKAGPGLHELRSVPFSYVRSGISDLRGLPRKEHRFPVQKYLYLVPITGVVPMMRIAASFLLMVPLVAFAADNPDATFYKHAAEGGMAEVELGNLAQAKAHNQSVKDFGAMMVKDHSAANDKLKSVAASKGVDLPTSPSVAQMATKTKLKVLSGDTFDKSYVKGMIKDHEEDIAEFKKEAASGQDPSAKAFAKATLPTLEKHLKRIQSVAADMGINAD
jgi:putative membrane protein